MKNTQAESKYHTPVLLKPTLDILKIKPNEWYIDCTVGGGGHSLEILRNGGKVLGIDQDEAAIREAQIRLSEACPSGVFELVKANFSQLKEIAYDKQIQPDGILFDLGVSSYQLGGNQRGFSFQVDEPLDMRMDPQNQTVTAKDLVNGLYEPELQKLLTEYGEDQLAKSIARALVWARKSKPIETTGELAQIVGDVYKRAYKGRSRINPATKTFQALRIAVNDELNNLKSALSAAFAVLKPEGRCVVISFHGLEDRIVKQTFKEWQHQQHGMVVTEKPIIATEAEVNNNPRSRSAKLRAFEKN